MNWNYRPVNRIQDLPAHLAELSRYLPDLSVRVHATVVEAIGNTVSQVVKDNLQRLWQRPAEFERPRPSRTDPSYWRDDDWSDDECWHEDDMSEPFATQRQSESPSQPSVRLGLAAMCMRATGWWLQRRGSWLQALGIGLGVGALALIGGPLALAGLGLAEAVAELIALNSLLSSGDALTR